MASPSPQSSPMPPPQAPGGQMGPPPQQQSSLNQTGISHQPAGSAQNFQDGQTQQQAYSAAPLPVQTQPDSQSYQQMPSTLGISQPHQNYESMQPGQQLQQQGVSPQQPAQQLYTTHQPQMSNNLTNIGQTDAVGTVQEPIPIQNGTVGPVKMNQVTTNGPLISPGLENSQIGQNLGMIIHLSFISS